MGRQGIGSLTITREISDLNEQRDIYRNTSRVAGGPLGIW